MLLFQSYSFNLNLLECKCLLLNQECFPLICVLISTYWNVNKKGLSCERNVMESFNLNLLECKSEQMRSKHLRIQSFNLNLLECKSLLSER